ncbi:SOS response-associated peptidase family protein [Rheinheimera sp. 1928-s]|uniref:SOS response-associated peptidase family protein n=1 Tax=Rheinheimera sp. 1928-s TaxID=3033803 RepID=UPI00262CCC98|nr:SOS response-associated peptidase family protein [Rheinheimera sp. 1928-s]MDF3127386.1 SOS response-associated peptidase family protein [Rheinheimera sp. 1928-s]
MCGRLNVIDCPEVIDLCGQLGINLQDQAMPLRTSRFIRATNKISIVVEQNGQRRLQDAIWWLLLEQAEHGYKPSQYTSFNTRYDKLNVKGSAGYAAFRTQRCIIPAAGFGETEVVNGKNQYTDFIGKSGLALGGLYRTWLNKETGELTYSCSVITLPPHPKLIPYHSKASPLMLSPNVFDSWLTIDRCIDKFENFLVPNLPVDLNAIRIDKPSIFDEISEPVFIKSD